MLNEIRQMPDLLMMSVMLALGMFGWAVIIEIPILWGKFKRTAACKYVQMAHENARLRKRIRKLQEENIRAEFSDVIHNPSNEICTMCGKTLDEWDKQEEFGFDYHVGYGSKHDCEHIKARFCCDCFDKIIDHIIDHSIHNPVVGDDTLQG